jgi:hypothetical protein
VNAPNVTITRGLASGPRGVVSGNLGGGINVLGANVRIDNQYVGANLAGTAAVPNGSYGIRIASSGGTIGGTAPGPNTVVSGNNGPGIIAAPSTGLTIAGNSIGLNAAGNAAVPNTGHGIAI